MCAPMPLPIIPYQKTNKVRLVLKLGMGYRRTEEQLRQRALLRLSTGDVSEKGKLAPQLRPTKADEDFEEQAFSKPYYRGYDVFPHVLYARFGVIDLTGDTHSSTRDVHMRRAVLHECFRRRLLSLLAFLFRCCGPCGLLRLLLPRCCPVSAAKVFTARRVCPEMMQALQPGSARLPAEHACAQCATAPPSPASSP